MSERPWWWRLLAWLGVEMEKEERGMPDWIDDPQAQGFIRGVLEDMVPKLRESMFTLQLVPDDAGDVKFWVELGASIMFDKPILVILPHGVTCPPKLALIADEVVEMPEQVDPTNPPKELEEAIQRIVKMPHG